MREFPRSWLALTLVVACTPSVDAVSPLERMLTLDESVDFVTGDVSPDGRYLSEIDWDTGDLQLIDLRTGEAVGVTGQGYGEGGYAWMSAFSPDGERIAVAWFGSVRGWFGIQRLAPLDGSFTTLPVSGEGLDGGTLKWVEVGPGGRTLYLFHARAGGRGRPLLAIDAATGAQELIGRYHADFRTLAVSPDGREVALVTREPRDGSTRLRVIPAVPDAGPGRVVSSTSERPGLTTPLAWTPDGARLVYATRSATGRVLWSVPADGRDVPVRIGGEAWCCQGHDLRFHPDGRRIAVPGGTPRAEIWRLRLPGG